MTKGKIKILLTGANGQLGSEFQYFAQNDTVYEWLFVDRINLDITDQEAVNQIFDKYQPNICINCAAYTAVDKAESDQKTAFLINETAVLNISEACAQHNCLLIHYSTDYVYDPISNHPLKETDACAPKSIYGKSKLQGEQKIINSNLKDYIILRTSWVYGRYGHNFFKTMLRFCSENKHLNVVYDQIGSPTYTKDIVSTTINIIDLHIKKPELDISGIYNYSNEGVCSWYDFAQIIYNSMNSNIELTPILTLEYPTPAPRPHFSVMDKSKTKKMFNISIPHWQQSLMQCIITLNQEQ
ncbi:MAG: dTDP-4-dehydrorhamnose reductase [Saprospiraceae bacterium]|nr:dTDP-4-dehydrorhamnose reductase [Saprospiraceae bacterium]